MSVFDTHAQYFISMEPTFDFSIFHSSHSIHNWGYHLIEIDVNENVLKYKGYIGSIVKEQDCYWGKILNEPNLCCVYEGKTLEELAVNFRDLVVF